MTAQVTFVPHPRLDYTMKYNQHLDYLKSRDSEIQRSDKDFEDKKLQSYQDSIRIQQNLQRVKEMNELNLYNFLDRVRAVNDYKYAYWVGTLVDQYI